MLPFGIDSFREVTTKLRKIIGKENRLKELTFQINIRTKGNKFDDFQTYFSRNVKALTVDELSSVLKRIMKEIVNGNVSSPELIVPIRSTLPFIS